MYIENGLTRTLDKLLEASEKHKGSHCLWIPIVKLPGFGTTSTLKAWLKHNNLNYLYVDAGLKRVTKFEVECFKKINYKSNIMIVNDEELENFLNPIKKEVNVIFTSDEIDSIDENTVIIIDDYLRTSLETRNELFNLIGYEKVIDIRLVENECERKIKPKIIVVVLDESLLDNLTDEEKRLFAVYC